MDQQQGKHQDKTKFHCWRLSYWPTHLLLFTLRCISQLSPTNRIRVGNFLGRVISKLIPKRRQVARTNITKCFPQYNLLQIEQLLRNNMEATGRGLVETASCWFTDLDYQIANSKVLGKEYLESALSKGNGVILLGFHLTTLEVGVSILCHHFPLMGMYKPNKNALFDHIMTKGRLNHFEGMIDRNDLRGMIRGLKNNKAVWYAIDQNYDGKKRVFAPFFGIPTATITAISKLCKITGAKVIPFTQKRLEQPDTYELQLYPALESIPSGDEVQDVTEINAFLESYLKQNPIDYMWLHHRFRTRPPGEDPFY